MATERPPAKDLALRGIIGGIIAGVVFIFAEMAMAAELDLEMIAPVRLVATVALGPIALSPNFDAATAMVVGTLVHLALSAIYGITFLFILAFTQQTRATPVLVVIYGAVFGLGLWALNFQLLAPELLPQFTMVDQTWMGLVPHVGCYGVVLGAVATVAERGAKAFVTW